LKENDNFKWTHTYYRGEKYEELGEKIFKYSLVELEESPIEPGSQTSKQLLDITFGSKLDSSYIFPLSETHLEDYIKKVMRKKMNVYELYTPKILGKDGLKLNVDVFDNEDYQNTATYYDKKTLSQYSEFVLERKSEFRACSEKDYSHLARGYIATATRYISSNLRNGIWGFTLNGTYSEGKYTGGRIFSYDYFYNNTQITIVQIIQPIININP